MLRARLRHFEAPESNEPPSRHSLLIFEVLLLLELGSRRLWIMLHGLGDSIEGYRWLPQAMRLPWMNYLLVNAPDKYYGGYSWYNFAGQPGDIVPGVERSRKLLFQLL